MRLMNSLIGPRMHTWSVVCWTLCLAWLTGCTTFHREWHAARVPAAPADATGPWEGTWTSEASGHHGRLRCLMTAAGPTGHQARFRATYAKILTFEYTVPLEFKAQGDRQEIQGEANLGSLAGGLYHYEGSITPHEFVARYSSQADHGVFRLHRPSAPATP